MNLLTFVFLPAFLLFIEIKSKKYFSGAVLLILLLQGTFMFFALQINSIDVFRIRGLLWPLPDYTIEECNYIYFIWSISFFASVWFLHRLIPMNWMLMRFSSYKFRPYYSDGIYESHKIKSNLKLSFTDITALLGIFLVTVSLDAWILFATYPTNKMAWALIPLGSMAVLGPSCLIISYLLYNVQNLKFRAKLNELLILIISVHYLLASDRGSFIFMFLGWLFVKIIAKKNINVKRLLAMSFLFFPAMIYVLLMTSGQRSGRFGSESISSYYGSIEDFIVKVDLLPQALGHLYHTVNFHSSYGPYLGADSWFAPFIYILQLIPAGILNIFNYDAYNSSLTLMKYAPHGGGFFVPADNFFTASYWGLISLPFLLAIFCVFNDRLIRGFLDGKNVNLVATALACLALVSLPYSFYYGFQVLLRMSSLPLVVYFILAGARMVFRSTIRNSAA